MHAWLKIVLFTSLPVLSHAHTVSPFLLPEVFDTKSAQNISFQSAITVEKFFVPGNNFKTTYIITEPDGQQKPINAAAELKRFNVAEFDLPKDGTYRIRTQDALGNNGKYALIDGRWLRVRPARAPMQAPAGKPVETATPQKAAVNTQAPRMIAADQVPANAKTLDVTNHFIAESYVTKGKPTAIPAPSKKGFECKLLTHPNELYVGESLKAQLLMNGKAVPNLEIEVFKGASSYEPTAKREMPHAKSNAKGEVEIKFDQPGIYLITMAYPEADADASKKPAIESFTYGLTVEVTE